MNGGLASISFASLSELAKQLYSPKVRNFDRIVVAKQVFRLEISVEVVLLVHVRQTLKRLEHDVSDHELWE